MTARVTDASVREATRTPELAVARSATRWDALLFSGLSLLLIPPCALAGLGLSAGTCSAFRAAGALTLVLWMCRPRKSGQSF